MKLSEYRANYYELSGKASDSARSLALAGIAVVWLFRASEPNPPVPAPLLLPLGLFALALAMDLLQYVSGAMIWGWFSRSKEKTMRRGPKDDPEIDAPPYANWAANACFYSKIGTLITGYVFLIRHIAGLWLR